MTKEGNSSSKWKMFGLIWILIECNLFSGSIFGFVSLFSVLPRYGIYESRCEILSEVIISDDTKTITKNCQKQIDEYQLAFALGIGFYNLPAVVLGMIGDFFGPRCLKMIGIIFHVISWLSLAFVAPGSDWLILLHTIFSALSGMCVLLSSFTIAANFTKSRGLITSLICGAQLSGTIWYALFQIAIDQNLISLSTLSFIWTSLAVFMLGSAILFLQWRFKCSDASNEKEIVAKDEINPTQETIARHLTDSLFILVTLYLSCFLLTVAFLPVVWFPWIMHLTGSNLQLANRYTFLYNMSALLALFIAPVCGLLIDYRANHGHLQRLLNLSILQTLTWIVTIILCIVCMFQTITAAISAIFIFIFSRTMLVSGCQAVITTKFPPEFIGTLLGIMWTAAGIFSFATYGLTRLATNPNYAWRAWLVILCLCALMIIHVIQLWHLYFKSKKGRKEPISIEENAEGEEMEKLQSLTDQ